MSTFPAPFGTKSRKARPFRSNQPARVIDLTEYRQRQAVDPLSGVRRRLRRAMTSRRISVEVLATESGLNPVLVASFMRGGAATPREITRMAAALGLNWSLLSRG